MDGVPLVKWFTSEFVEQNPPKWKNYDEIDIHQNQKYSTKENSLIENRLKDLGYL